MNLFFEYQGFYNLVVCAKYRRFSGRRLDILCGDLHLKYWNLEEPEKEEPRALPGEESLTMDMNILGGLLKTLKKWHKTVSPGEDLWLA